jgi:hypothetical protein
VKVISLPGIPGRVLAAVACVVAALGCNGCVLTKLVTVPMRVGAAAISIVPGAGNAAHDAVDEAAEIIDDVPI